MLRNPQDCEDALQEGLLLAFRNLQTILSLAVLHLVAQHCQECCPDACVENAMLTSVFSEEDLANGGDLTLEELSVDAGLALRRSAHDGKDCAF